MLLSNARRCEVHLQLHLHLWKTVVLPGITMGQTDLWPDAQNSATQSPKAQTATPSLAANVTSPSPLPTVHMTEGVCEWVRGEGTEKLQHNQSLF